MYSDGITLPNGSPLMEGFINPLMGYQCEHFQTGRLLPQCYRHEVFGWWAMLERLDKVSDNLIDDWNFNVADYYIVPMYLSEIDEMDDPFYIINDEDMTNNNGNLFN